MVDKAREGKHKALQEGEVVTRHGPTVTAQLKSLDANTAALARILTQLSNPPAESGVSTARGGRE